jgi:hypothetical protein
MRGIVVSVAPLLAGRTCPVASTLARPSHANQGRLSAIRPGRDLGAFLVAVVLSLLMALMVAGAGASIAATADGCHVPPNGVPCAPAPAERCALLSEQMYKMCMGIWD